MLLLRYTRPADVTCPPVKRAYTHLLRPQYGRVSSHNSWPSGTKPGPPPEPATPPLPERQSRWKLCRTVGPMGAQKWGGAALPAAARLSSASSCAAAIGSQHRSSCLTRCS